MKQHITPEQLQELSEEQKERLRRWWEPGEGELFCRYEYDDPDMYDISVVLYYGNSSNLYAPNGSMCRGANRVEGKLPSLLVRACEAIQIIAKGCCYAYPRQN